MQYDEAPLPCADKLAFNSPEEASATAALAEYRYGSAVRPYQCKHCGLWHLSSA